MITQSARDKFVDRHIGPNDSDIEVMLKALDCTSLQDITSRAAPAAILDSEPMDLPQAMSEEEFLKHSKRIADKNQLSKSFIGLGYYGCHTPKVILRNVLENPGWYTAYTPYQAEISQGRMEALLNFQTVVTDLTGMEVANSSLLDEATAAAEAINFCLNVKRKVQKHQVFVAENCLPQTIEVVQTRAQAVGIDVIVGNAQTFDFSESVFAALIQYPAADGEIIDYQNFIDQAHDNDCMVICAADLLSLCLLKPPGELGADVAIGTTQRFGVPMGFGGPHAAYFATYEKYKRSVPGRIIGLSKDAKGNPALRLALQTREQHIRREKATSNICTAQVLLAVMASMYAVYHGPAGLKQIATSIHHKAKRLYSTLIKAGLQVRHDSFFDTLALEVSAEQAEKFLMVGQSKNINFARLSETTLGISFDETTTEEDLQILTEIFTGSSKVADATGDRIEKQLLRSSDFLQHPTFNSYGSETEMLRYIHSLEEKDLALNKAMIPLGSCTMKLNATAEMIPVTWPEFANIHPFAPIDQSQGYQEMIAQLESWLSQITGFAATSVQPNAGSQGEYSGLLVVRKYLESQGQGHRNICLIPSSAHGTNPASAVMAGMKVVVVGCDQHGNIDLNDLNEKVKAHSDHLAALMVTYPSTHGVFETSIIEICDIVHKNGGQVYMDGANLNALVGISKPGRFGPDVCHLNLHKTFCIPHGGGGPGVGPISVAEHLKDFLPRHRLVPECGPSQGITAVSAAPWGSASILPISWGYIAMMGEAGLRKATEVSILSANYIAKKLEGHYPVLYKSKEGWVAHECIIDVREFRDKLGITVDDIAKRLMDYGFHAPTMSWPVAGTLMIEPTESESLQEIHRFCEAMISIREEIRDVAEGRADKTNNVLKNSPHSVHHLMATQWDHPYTREQAAFPKPWVKGHKFWVPVSRVDNAFGDKNLVCSCPPMEAYE